jgi:Holliday junction resolvase RusA-like endonuclease
MAPNPRTYRFTVKGQPRAKGRPRFGKGRTYTPHGTVVAEAKIAAAYAGPKFEGPVSLACVFSNDRVTITLTPMEIDKSPLRGDVSNYLKLVEDALNGHAYEDDRQVHRLIGKKK